MSSAGGAVDSPTSGRPVGAGTPSAPVTARSWATVRTAAASRLGALLPVLAFALACTTLAGRQAAGAATETLYLALLGGSVLLGAALLAPAGSWTAATGALLASAAVWMLPSGPPRGAALGIVLVATTMAAGLQRLRRGEIDAAAAVGGALAVQALLRGAELLPATLLPLSGATAPALGRLLLPPVLAGLALAELARRQPLSAVLAAGIAAALAAEGFTVTAALPLLAIAALERARREPLPAAEPVAHDPRPVAAEPAAVAEGRDPLAGARRRGHGWLGGARQLASAPAALGIAAVVLGALRPAAGALALTTAAARRLPGPWCWLAATLPLAIAVVVDPVPARLLASAALPALLPFAFLPGGAAPRHLLAAAAVGAGGALLLPGTAGLAAAAAALALATRSSGAAGTLQHGWLAFLLAAGALGSGYPWLRAQPLDTALSMLGMPAVSGGRGGIVSAAVLLAAALLLLEVAKRSRRAAGVLLAGALAAAALLAMPPVATNVAPPDGTTLRADAAAWTAPVSGPVTRLRVVSTLADAATLPAGTAVATLALEREGKPLAAWTLRAGTDTAEWAADRPDLRGVAAAGPVWWSWLPPPGTFFAHAYAAAWRPSRPVPATSVRIERAPTLPPQVTFSLLRLEVSR